MHITSVALFYIIGIATITSNEYGKSASDIPQLWQRFFSENIIDIIPDKVDNSVYCVYADYERDHTKPYTTILGCRVNSLETVPAGLTATLIEGGPYRLFTAEGKIADGIVFSEWTKIWNTDISRVYTADFEVYGEKALDPDDAAIDIFIAVK